MLEKLYPESPAAATQTEHVAPQLVKYQEVLAEEPSGPVE
jgi:hypothetical protein